jgi:hypothetical protein
MDRRSAVALAFVVLATACFSSEVEPSPRAEKTADEANEETLSTINTRSGPIFEPTPIEKVTKPAGGWLQSGCELPREYVLRIWRGYRPDRSPEIMVVPREPNIIGALTPR